MLDLTERVNCFTLELYEDSSNLDFKHYIDIVSTPDFYTCKWYYIKHDKDKDKNGVLKKEHYHLLVKLENAVSIERICKLLDNGRGNFETIVNDFSIVKSFKGMVRYLIHYDEKSDLQHHYELKEIITNDRNLSYYFNDNTIIDNFKLIYSIVDDNKICSFRGLIKYCVENNNVIAMQYIQDNAYLVSCLFRK